MNMKIVGITLTVVVGVIMLGGCLMPVILDANRSFSTAAENEGGLYTVSTVNVPITFSSSDAGYTLNGDVVQADYNSGAQMMIVSDKFIVATNPLNESRAIYLVIPGESFKTISSITCSGGNITYTTDADHAATVGYSWIAYPANDGKYMYAGELATVSIDDDVDAIVGYMGPAFAGESSLSAAIMAKGKIATITPMTYAGNDYAAVTGSIYADFSAGRPNELTPLYGISILDDGQTYLAQTINVFVPLEYHYQSGQDANIGNLLVTIPVLIIIAMLLGVVGVIFSRRD